MKARRSVAPSDAFVERVRVLSGGNIVPTPSTVLRWYHADIESAMRRCDNGDMSYAAKLWRACQTDGKVRGVLGTRTGGFVRLPKQFEGPPEMVEYLSSKRSGVSVFDEVFPVSELTPFINDAIGLGVAIGEFLPVVGRPYPVFCRLDPEFLRYQRSENTWYYQSIAGTLPVTPGDGRWVLYTLGGRVNPWQYGIWPAIATPWVDKLHARSYDNNWLGKLANPARVAQSPNAATEAQREGWFNAVGSWGVNTVFEAEPGYEVKLVESNGRGHDAFENTIVRSDREIVVGITGQEVTTDGGAGFQNGDLFKSIRADLIQETADTLAHCLNTQGIPIVIASQYGIVRSLYNIASVSWDVTPPQDRMAAAKALSETAKAIDSISEALAKRGLTADITPLLSGTGLVADALPEKSTTAAKLDLAPTDIAKCVRVDEVRVSQGLPPIGDERGVLTISEISDKGEEAA